MMGNSSYKMVIERKSFGERFLSRFLMNQSRSDSVGYVITIEGTHKGLLEWYRGS